MFVVLCGERNCAVDTLRFGQSDGTFYAQLVYKFKFDDIEAAVDCEQLYISGAI